MSSDGSIPEDGQSSGGMSSPPPSPNTLDFLNDKLESVGLLAGASGEGGGGDAVPNDTEGAAALAASRGAFALAAIGSPAGTAQQAAVPTHRLMQRHNPTRAAAPTTPLHTTENRSLLLSTPRINTGTIPADLSSGKSPPRTLSSVSVFPFGTLQ